MTNEVTRLLGDQLKGDIKALPGRLRPRRRRTAGLRAAGSIEELRGQARRRLPRVVFDFVDGGAEDEVTLGANVSDLAKLRITPRVLVGVEFCDTSATLFGQTVEMPVLGAPTGLTGLIHHEGEAALARAVEDAGSIYVLSAMASYTVEEVAAGTQRPFWFQVYAWRDRDLVMSLIERARAAGCSALVLTVDVPMAGNRERDRRNGFGIPPRLTPGAALQGLLRPGWTKNFLTRPRIAIANATSQLAAGDAVSLLAYVDSQFDRSLRWQDLAWIREAWTGPLLIKGIICPEDARRAVDLGADGVVVSNHGGRQLDGAPSSISALPGVVDAVGDDCVVLMDGGVRRGTDVLKAVALGAEACLVGRPLVYGLGAGGEAGATRALEILRDDLRRAMTLAGCPSLRELERGQVIR